MVKEDEILPDFSMALRLGHRPRYLEGCRDDVLPSWDMRKADYTSFIKSWADKTIEVQVYAINTAPNDDTLAKEAMETKDFLFLIIWDYTEDYLKNEGSTLMNKKAVIDCMQLNTMIQSVYFHSEKETDMRKVLQYLRQHPTYSTLFSRSRLLQFFVVDLKKMSFPLSVSGGVTTLFSVALLVHLLQSIMEDGRKEMSVYCMFGEDMYTLKGCYVQHTLALARRHTVAGCLMATLVVSVLVLMARMGLSAVVTILLSLLLPLLVSTNYLFLLILTAHQLVKRACMVKELFCDEKNGNT